MGVIPDLVPNFIDGEEVAAASGARFDNINPHDGSVLCEVASSEAEDIGRAVAFLASDDADYVTASVMRVDGGLIAAESHA